MKDTIIIAVLCLLLGVIATHLYGVRKIRNLETTIDAQAAEAKQYRNIQGKLITEKLAMAARLQDIERAYPDLKKKLQTDFDIRTRNLRAYYEGKVAVTGQGNADIVLTPGNGDEITLDPMQSYLTISAEPLPNGHGYYYIANNDTVKMTYESGRLSVPFEPFALVIQDGYLDLQADVYSETRAPYQYVYTDTLELAWHRKRERWFGPKRLYVSGMLRNTNASIGNTKSVWVDEPRKPFGIGPYVGYGIGPAGSQVTIGVSAHYSLIRF